MDPWCVATMFERFPKHRPALPEAYREIYKSYYRANRQGKQIASRLAQALEGWMHRRVAADVVELAGATLEIGAGTLNHIRHEPATTTYDIVEPQPFLYETSPVLGRVRHRFADLAEVSSGLRYQRIISIAAFEHICNLPEVVARCGLLLADGGRLRVAIPSEGEPLWKLAWRCSTGLQFRLKYGLDYGVLMNHEHVNTAAEIRAVLHYFFRDTKAQLFGVSRPLSLYQFYVCATPDRAACSQYLEVHCGGPQTSNAAHH